MRPTPTEAGTRDYSEGLVPQYFDLSFYIVKLLLYKLGYLKDSNAAAHSVDTGIS